MSWPGVLTAFRERLPSVAADTPVVTLHEGGTPLVEAPHLSALAERPVFLKLEGANPTGSFKDRGMTLAVSKAVEAGAPAVICASTGNTSASAAAYAARAGLRCVVVLPAGNVAKGKLAQAAAHGAVVVPVSGSFDDALAIVKELADVRRMILVNSVNPHRLEGQQTISWEVLDQLGATPAVHALPVGNAGNITAHWMGYRRAGVAPRMWGFQAAGAAPIVLGRVVTEPRTIATAIRIGHPENWESALVARDESGGRISAVTDDRILHAYRLLAAEEGVFCEPASAAAVAGLIAYRAHLPAGPVVCTLTGHGLKDPDTAIAGASLPEPVEPSLDAVGELLDRLRAMR